MQGMYSVVLLTPAVSGKWDYHPAMSGLGHALGARC
jgi:hypothetical protein